MAANPAAWAGKHREPVWEACVAPKDRPSIQGWASGDRLLKDMDRAGIEKAILLGWYWENHENCRLQNRMYGELINRHPDRLLAFASVQARDARTGDEIKHARENGFSGIGEIHPQAQGFSLKDACWQKLLEAIQNSDLPINLHVTDPSSRDHPGKIETPLGDYVEMAESWPKQVFILAHLGALIPLKEPYADRIRRRGNVYFDCAAIPLLYPSSVLREMVNRVGRERILFGTDYPLKTFPKVEKEPGFIGNVQFIKDSGLTGEDLRHVFSSNAKRLFPVR